MARPVRGRLLWYSHREASATGVRFSTVIPHDSRARLDGELECQKPDQLRSGTRGTKTHCPPGISKTDRLYLAFSIRRSYTIVTLAVLTTHVQ